MPGARITWLTIAAVAATLAAGAPTGAAALPRPPSITLDRVAGQRVKTGYGETVRLGQTVVVTGTVTDPPPHSRVRLQGRTSAGWHALVTVPDHGGSFTLRWPVRARVTQLRVALLARDRRIATSATASLLAGSAIVHCRPAMTPAELPAGDGWIEGGVYDEGGPAPGIDQCQSTPSTVTAMSTSGVVVASRALSGGDGYALVVPAGSYQLQDGACTGEATVVPGRPTAADTVCAFP